jgi:hypothetical protein
MKPNTTKSKTPLPTIHWFYPVIMRHSQKQILADSSLGGLLIYGAKMQGCNLTLRSAFIEYVLNHLPQLPEQYVEIKRVNIGLTQPDENTASELELGKNICALSDAYGI